MVRRCGCSPENCARWKGREVRLVVGLEMVEVPGNGGFGEELFGDWCAAVFENKWRKVCWCGGDFRLLVMLLEKMGRRVFRRVVGICMVKRERGKSEEGSGDG
ncbi:hypothetical protein HAX54_034554, partial [Datura stramonium]|nr:hypothetical protein [Datura stramonium]